MLLFSFSDDDDKYSLEGPQNYTVFSGEITVSYVIPERVNLTRPMIQLIDIKTGLSVYSTDLITGYSRAEANILCGVINTAGIYLFKMIDFGGVVLVESENMHASWPDISLVLPTSHTALTTSVSMNIAFVEVLCKSSKSDTDIMLKVEFVPSNVMVRGNTNVFPTNSSEVREKHSEVIRAFHIIQNRAKTFSCDIFDQEGTYRVSLVLTYQEKITSVITSSTTMDVSWSTEYNISMTSKSIFPCMNHITLYYKNPQCASSEDKIRLYELTPTVPPTLSYATEKRVRRGGTSLTINCNMFHDSFLAYCFKYISFANNGASTLQNTLCVPSIAGNGKFTLDSLFHG